MIDSLPPLTEPAEKANNGVCCGNFTTGGEYLGQSETICCGQPDDSCPDYFTAGQMQAYARASIEADRVSRDVPAAGVSDESCDSVILAIDAWARGVDHYEFGLPIHHDDGMVTCRGIIRSVFSATQQVAKPVPRFPFCERKDPHAREMQPVQAQPGGSGGFGQKLFPEVSAFCPKLFPQATGFDTQPKPANQQKE